jgi:hypothetical protein
MGTPNILNIALGSAIVHRLGNGALLVRRIHLFLKLKFIMNRNFFFQEGQH